MDTVVAVHMSEQFVSVIARIGFDDIGIARFVALAISYTAFVRFMGITPELGSEESEQIPSRFTLLAIIEIVFYPFLCLSIFVWYCVGMPLDSNILGFLGLAFVFLIPVLASFEECRRLWKARF